MVNDCDGRSDGDGHAVVLSSQKAAGDDAEYVNNTIL